MDTREKYREYINTSMVSGVEPLVFERAEGALVYAEGGKQYLDCFAGIAVTNSGHSNPEVIAAAKAQAEKYVHIFSYGYYNKPLADLAEQLACITPGRLKRSFFANSGAEANEGAMRMVKQYTGKHEFIAIEGSFHGRSYATLSITGNAARKKRGGPYMSGVTFAPIPYCYRCPFKSNPESCDLLCADYIENIIKFDTSNDVAAFIAEPVLGEGGIILPPDGYFTRIKEILDNHHTLLIIDEVQTGFGRTGKMFGIEDYGATPDVITMAKGIANGFPISAFIAPDEIANSFMPGEHLTTFGGNAVSAAAALANINFMVREKIPEKAATKGTMLMEKLHHLKEKYPIIGDVRGKGLMIGVELVGDAQKTPAAQAAQTIKRKCFEQGVLIWVGGVWTNVLRIQPPLVITEEQLEEAVAAIDRALADL